MDKGAAVAGGHEFFEVIDLYICTIYLDSYTYRFSAIGHPLLHRLSKQVYMHVKTKVPTDECIQ